MTDKYQNKYRIPSARLQNWNYGWNAPYFVTICTQNRECYFGDIVDGKIQLSEIGEMAQKYWMEIPQQFPFVQLGAFVVMPNHVHGIIIIDKPDDGRDDDCTDAINRVSTDNPTPKKQGGISGNKNPMLNENLSLIIRWFKGRTSFECRKIHADFAWQPRFHDHIIRNNISFEKIQSYIIENSLKWKDDKFFISKI